MAIGLAVWACDDDKSQKAGADATTSDAAVGKEKSAEKSGTPDTSSDEPFRTKGSSEKPAKVDPNPPLEVEGLIVQKDVKALSGDPLTTTRLAGRAPGPTYNALRVYPKGRDEYGAAVQLWKLDDAKAAAKRVGELRPQYLGTDDPSKSDAPVKDRSAFISQRQGIWQYVFSPRNTPYVAAVSCHEKFCGDWKVLYELGSKINQRLLERHGVADKPSSNKKGTAPKDTGSKMPKKPDEKGTDKPKSN